MQRPLCRIAKAEAGLKNVISTHFKCTARQAEWTTGSPVGRMAAMESRLQAPRCSFDACVRRLTAATVLASAACTNTPYRATWQPMTSQDVYPPLVGHAIALEPSELPMVERAGGVFIGYQATHRKYSPRASSVGGTHFIAVAGQQITHTSCSGGVIGGVALSLCSSRGRYRPTKVAVYRVEAARWNELPPHLVPPTSDVEMGVAASATRDGCSIGNAWGITKCSHSWRVRSHLPTPIQQAAPPVSPAVASEEATDPERTNVPINPY